MPSLLKKGTTDVKYKTSAWQKQRQLQVTQGTMALNGKEVSRKQILNIVVPPNSKNDVNQNPEVKAEPLDDEIAEVVEFDDRPLNEARLPNTIDNVEFSARFSEKFPQLARFRQKALTKQKVLHSHNSNANNNRGNSSSDDESMAVIDCAGNGTDMVSYSSDDVMTIKSNEQRVRPPYRFRVDYFYA